MAKYTLELVGGPADGKTWDTDEPLRMMYPDTPDDDCTLFHQYVARITPDGEDVVRTPRGNVWMEYWGETRRELHEIDIDSRWTLRVAFVGGPADGETVIDPSISTKNGLPETIYFNTPNDRPGDILKYMARKDENGNAVCIHGGYMAYDYFGAICKRSV